MSLTLPSPQDLYAFWGDEANDQDNDRAQLLIELSANLLWIATGLEDDPADSRLASLVKLAIMDMAISLFIHRDNIDAEYSPFASERIGSYSYSKAFTKASSAIASNGSTGASIFDALIEYFRQQAMGTWVSSEFVFTPGYIPLEQEIALENVFKYYRSWLDGYEWH